MKTNEDGPQCPYCDYVHENAEDWNDVVTYWGEQTTAFVCGKCEREFIVNEVVCRYWESTPQ